jgi:hypothetical protein
LRAQSYKEVAHLFSQIPTIDRPAVNNDESIFSAEFLTTFRAGRRIETKYFEVSTTRDHGVRHVAPAQTVPILDHIPDFRVSVTTPSADFSARVSALLVNR